MAQPEQLQREPRSRGESTTVAAPRRRALAGPLLVLGLTALLALPLIVALVRFRGWTWYPTLDIAMTELRVRDVGTGNTPLVGLPGRIGTFVRQGSHPGPLSFYLLAPVYRLLGSSSWALQAACVVLQIAAIAVALLIARRRGNSTLTVAVAAVLAVLMTGYSFNVLTEPWNPYLPVLPWVVFLLALWSVVCGDLAMLPVLVAAGTFCAQTHVPYLALTVALGGVAGVATLGHWWSGRHDRRERRRVLWWSLAALGVGVLLWAPPTIDQLLHDPGNYRILVDHFVNPTEPMIGAGRGLALAVERLDLLHLVGDQFRRPGTLVSVWPGHTLSLARGTACAVLWLISVVAALLLRQRALVQLHAVLAVSLLVGVYALSHIFGTVWYYLMLWMWGVAALLAMAIGWTVAAAVARLLAPEQLPRARAIVTAALVLFTAAFAVRLTIAATSAVQAENLTSDIGQLVDATTRAIEDGVGAADGRDRRYIIYWSDTLHMGSQGFALLSELERRGFNVGVPPSYSALATPHRVVEPADAVAAIVLANGAFIAKYRALPAGVEVAVVDPRSPEERREYDGLRAAVVAELRGAGLANVVPEIDRNLFASALAPGIPTATRDHIVRMLHLGATSAVFIFPPDFRPALTP